MSGVQRFLFGGFSSKLFGMTVKPPGLPQKIQRHQHAYEAQLLTQDL
jgi:hypothetical protein